MTGVTFNIQSWAGWTKGMQEPASGSPALLRRRISPVGKIALGLAWDIPDAAHARYIFSSQHGEFDRTLSLLKAAIHQELLSPADFTLSVHHALIGLLSIAQNNKRGHTAIAAGEDSFCSGLIEAAACLAENPHEPVLFIHCEDNLPAPYDSFALTTDRPIALVMLLTASGSQMVTLNSDSAINSHKTNHAVQFFDFLMKDLDAAQSQSAGYCWKWTRHAAA